MCALDDPGVHGLTSPKFLHMSTRWAAWLRGIRWLVGGIAAVIFVLEIAWVLFVPATDGLAHHDVAAVTGQLLRARHLGIRVQRTYRGVLC